MRETHQCRLARIFRQAGFGRAIYSNRFLSAPFSRYAMILVNLKFTFVTKGSVLAILG